VSWRTNKKTKNVFPVGQRPEAVERRNEEEGEIVPEEPEAYTCAGCGKAFVGQAYEVEGQIICPDCNRLDSRLQREESRKAKQGPENGDSGVGLPDEDADDSSGKKDAWWGSGVTG
jgi:hypothetical protein